MKVRTDIKAGTIQINSANVYQGGSLAIGLLAVNANSVTVEQENLNIKKIFIF